jgi:glycosyltransferase involved in cell wall biosynthesis
LIVGDGSEKSALEIQARELGVADHVIFTGARFDIPEVFQVLDVYLLPSLSEGLPLGILEAMAAGCPIIASRVGGIPAISQNGRHVVLFKPKDVKEMTKKILELLSSPKLRKSLSESAFEHFTNNFSAQVMADKYSKLYTEKNQEVSDF